jgi:hypothetical protein
MPELPEVEVAARNLRRWTAGRAIARAEADPRARYVFRPSRLRRSRGDRGCPLRRDPADRRTSSSRWSGTERRSGCSPTSA